MGTQVARQCEGERDDAALGRTIGGRWADASGARRDGGEGGEAAAHAHQQQQLQFAPPLHPVTT